jgi:hypothetical protein
MLFDVMGDDSLDWGAIVFFRGLFDNFSYFVVLVSGFQHSQGSLQGGVSSQNNIGLSSL